MAARTTRSRRNAKMDLMTGFTGEKPPDLDLGLDGKEYFAQWTTVGLPDTGKNSAVDDDAQPSGSGAPATSIPGPPLKVPMEADDVERPKIREGREAKRAQARILRKVASEVRRLDPITARRLMAAADELTYDALSTASLPEAGDENNEVDDYHDNFGHGKLQFYGTDPAKSTSLTRESSRRRVSKEGKTCEVSYKPPGGNWTKKACTQAELAKLKDEGAEIKEVRQFDREKEDVDSNMEFASRGASRRRSAAGGDKINDISVDNSLKLVKGALDGQYDRDAVAAIFKSDYDRIVGLLKGGGSASAGGAGAGASGGASQAQPAQTQAALASRRSRRARTQGDKSLKPQPTVGDQDGPGADGAGGFYKRSKAPLQETMAADDVERPTIRENPEASRSARVTAGYLVKQFKDGWWLVDKYNGTKDYGPFKEKGMATSKLEDVEADQKDERERDRRDSSRMASLWAAFRSEIIRQASGGGKWNSGHYAIEARDYGDSVEVQASVVDRENLPMPVGSILFSKLHDSPQGRYATVEVNDGILENRTTEFTLRKPRQASRVAGRVVAGIVQMAKDVLDEVTM